MCPPKYQINLMPTFGSGLLSCSSYLKPLGAEMENPFETSDVTVLDSFSGLLAKWASGLEGSYHYSGSGSCKKLMENHQ